MEIVDGIHRVDGASSNMAHSNVYLVINGSDLTVIDTGTPGNAKKTVEYIQKLGYKPSDLSTIILTHFHMDHSGSAKELKDLTNAKLAVGAQDADFVSGTKPLIKPKNALIRAAASFVKFSPVQVDTQLQDGNVIGGLTVISVPGHSPGSIALLDPNHNALFAGDTLRYEHNKIVRAPKPFTWDEDLEMTSIKRIAAFDFETLLPGHGEILQSGASAAVKALVASLEKA